MKKRAEHCIIFGIVFVAFAAFCWGVWKLEEARVPEETKIYNPALIPMTESNLINLEIVSNMTEFAFCNENGEVGRLIITSDTMIFEGNAEESAKVFFKYLKEQWEERR